MRKALVIGIDHYDVQPQLTGCVNDACSVMKMLERHADGSINFVTPLLRTCGTKDQPITRSDLRKLVRTLFEDDAEVALFYFAGHGFLDNTGGFLCATDSETGDDGLSVRELMEFATQSAARHKVIILDSCHSGAAGNRANSELAELTDGMTILTASTDRQAASESNGSGVFTSLLVDALNGAAANLMGDITPGSVYAHIDQSLGTWAQRPMFKTNIKSFISLRKVEPALPLKDMQALAGYFPSGDYRLPLDPSFEPVRSEEEKRDPSIPPPDPKKNAIFGRLQRYARVGLVRPVGAEHMYFAAMTSQSCELTPLGRHYRDLVGKGLI